VSSGWGELSSVVPSDRIRDNRLKLENRKVNLNMRKNFFTLGVTEHWSRLPGRLWILLLWRYSKPTWMLFCATSYRQSSLAGSWTGGSPEVPFKP